MEDRFSHEEETTIVLQHPDYYIVIVEAEDADNLGEYTEIPFTVPAAQLPGFIYVLTLNGLAFRSEPAGAI